MTTLLVNDKGWMQVFPNTRPAPCWQGVFLLLQAIPVHLWCLAGGKKKKVLHGRKQKSRRNHRALAFCHCTVLPNTRNLTTVPGMPKCYKLCFLPPSGQVFLKSRSFQKSCHTLSCSHWNVYEEKTTGIGDQLFSQKHLLYWPQIW